jgi:hypothetical protein
VAEREEERLQISRKVNADQFLQELEAKSEKLFWELEVQENLGENLPRMKELAETWDPPVFELVKQLAEASKLNTIWTIKTKIATLPGRTTPSLIWETLFQWRGRYWYVIELKLDREFQPECFRVECGERDHWIDAPVTLDGLKTALVEAYKLRFVSDQKRKELAGWILREETGKRY